MLRIPHPWRKFSRVRGRVEVKDEVALVTGSARGIGKATALRLAREGYKVVVCDLATGEASQEVVNEIKNTGGIAIELSCDV